MKALTAETARLIASAQVITSPRSVVKELVENALDAGATCVDVRLDACGLERIEVRDNGSGIAAGDREGAARPHRTSKLADSDPRRLQTYGFRGEALAALAAVADVTIATKTHADDVGVEYVVGGDGSAGAARPVARGDGTTVVARSLFARIPVRRRALADARGRREELRAVENLLAAYGAARPRVRLTLRRDRDAPWQKDPTPDRRAALGALWGAAAAARLVRVVEEAAAARVEAFLPDPAAPRDLVTRPTPDRCLVFVNGRPVRWKAVAHLLREHAFPGDARRRHPVACVSFEAPPAGVDANVEPDKSRVLLSDEEGVLDVYLRCLRHVYGDRPRAAADGDRTRAAENDGGDESVERPCQRHDGVEGGGGHAEADENDGGNAGGDRPRPRDDEGAGGGDRPGPGDDEGEGGGAGGGGAEAAACRGVRETGHETATRPTLPVRDSVQSAFFCGEVAGAADDRRPLMGSAATVDDGGSRDPISGPGVVAMLAPSPSVVAPPCTSESHHEPTSDFCLLFDDDMWNFTACGDDGAASGELRRDETKRHDVMARHDEAMRHDVMARHDETKRHDVMARHDETKRHDVMARHDDTATHLFPNPTSTVDIMRRAPLADTINTRADTAGPVTTTDVTSEHTNLLSNISAAPATSGEQTANRVPEVGGKNLISSDERKPGEADAAAEWSRGRYLQSDGAVAPVTLLRPPSSVPAPKRRADPTQPPPPQRPGKRRKLSGASLSSPRQPVVARSSVVELLREAARGGGGGGGGRKVSRRVVPLAFSLADARGAAPPPDTTEEKAGVKTEAETEAEVTLVGCAYGGRAWLCRHGDAVYALNVHRLHEIALFERLARRHLLPTQPLSPAVALSRAALGGDPCWRALVAMATDADGRVVDARLAANGFEVALASAVGQGAPVEEARVTAIASCVPRYGVADLREVLEKVAARGEGATVRATRPAAVVAYLRGEAVRMARALPSSLPRRDVADAISALLEGAGGGGEDVVARHCFHGRPCFVAVCDAADGE